MNGDSWVKLEINSRWQDSPSYPTQTKDRVKSSQTYRFFIPKEYGRHILQIDYRLEEGAAEIIVYDGRRSGT